MSPSNQADNQTNWDENIFHELEHEEAYEDSIKKVREAQRVGKKGKLLLRFVLMIK